MKMKQFLAPMAVAAVGTVVGIMLYRTSLVQRAQATVYGFLPSSMGGNSTSSGSLPSTLAI